MTVNDKPTASKNMPLHPSSADADMFYRSGRQYALEKDYAQAIVQFNQVLKTSPYHLGALNNLAFCLQVTERPDLALKTYQLADRLSPNHTNTLLGIAGCYKAQGNFDEAISLYEKVLKAEPDNAECLFNLVLMKDYALDAPVAGQLHKLYCSAGCIGESRILTCFALAKLHENHKKHQEAFRYYQEANRLQSSSAPYLEADWFQYFDTVQNSFDAALFARLKNTGRPDMRPIFVVGMPRSGTTLVEQILASHSDVHGVGEIEVMPRIAEKLIPQMTGQRYPLAICTLKPSVYAALADHYLKELQSYCPDENAHIVDKMPVNFFHIGLIRLLFPQAAIIHCARDPMDTCWSLYRQHFVGNHPYCYDLAALGRYYVRYQKLMQHWQRVLSGEIYDVQYEQLVEAPEKTIRALLEHCGLPWEEQCLDFHRTKRSVSSASMRQVRQPIYKSSLKSWEPVAEALAPLRAALQL